MKRPSGQKRLSARETPPKRCRAKAYAASEIVASDAFSNVKPVTCSGGAYQFDAMRDQPFLDNPERQDGELIRAPAPALQ